MALTPEQFHYSFTNTLSEGESRAVYERYHVSGPGHVLFQAATTNLNPHAAAKVAFKSESCARSWWWTGARTTLFLPRWPKKLSRARAKPATEYKEYPGHSHYTLNQDGWEEVADYALDGPPTTRRARRPEYAGYSPSYPGVGESENKTAGREAYRSPTSSEGATVSLVAVLAFLLLASRRGPAQIGISVSPRDVSHERAVGRCLTASLVGTARVIPYCTLAAKSVSCDSRISGVGAVLERPRVAIQDRAEAVRRSGEGEGREDYRHNQSREKRPCAYLHIALSSPPDRGLNNGRTKKARGGTRRSSPDLGLGSLYLVLLKRLS